MRGPVVVVVASVDVLGEVDCVDVVDEPTAVVDVSMVDAAVGSPGTVVVVGEGRESVEPGPSSEHPAPVIISVANAMTRSFMEQA